MHLTGRKSFPRLSGCLPVTTAYPLALIGSHAYNMARSKQRGGVEQTYSWKFLPSQKPSKEEDEVARE